MKALSTLVITLIFVFATPGQDAAQKIYETERAFEKLVAEQGIRAGFLEYLTSDAFMFFPEAANARETWTKQPAGPAALTWNPILINVSSNGAVAYSIGNSVYRPKGKDDPTAYAGHYISIWMRQPNGDYRAVLDTGINHEAPARTITDWTSKKGNENNERAPSAAADFSVGFYQLVEAGSTIKAYEKYLDYEAIMMRNGSQPFHGRKAAVAYLESQKGQVKYAKRKSFVEAADLGYVHGPYSITDKSGSETERGNYVQVWRFRGGRWQIVADVLIPIPKAK